jgi:hypothetical protein
MQVKEIKCATFDTHQGITHFNSISSILKTPTIPDLLLSILCFQPKRTRIKENAPQLIKLFNKENTPIVPNVL